MAISITDFKVAIRIDNSEAKVKFEETREEIAKVKSEMDKLAESGKKDSTEYKELKKQHDKLNKSFYELRKEAGLTALTYNELRKKASTLRAQMNNNVPGTEKWKALRADYLLTKQRMKELEVQARDTRFSLSKLTDGFNKYAAIGASAIASLTGVAMTARKCVDEYAKMEEAEAQVVKYTGMTRAEVKELNEEFKKMDTRTPREKLNALAGDAGRLGITAKKDVLEFVDAANQINVALGEDLGEDAVKNIGKLAQMFGEDEKLGLRGAMLATASAINEVAQNSSAAEAYLVAFTARVAGAANQAKVAQGDILGYASVLDQNMQQQEMAATAFQTLMMKMFQEPAKFAKIAGQSVEEFSSLIKNDANEAILQFLDTLNKKGGLDQLAPMFKEMGLDGVRASGVISTMAGKIDDVRVAQKLANDAYRDGTSATNEYNIQNNTVQAGLDKARENFKNVRIQLGEKLLPIMRYMVTTGSLTVKGLSAIVSVLSEYKGAILTAATAVAAYTLYVKAGTIATAAYNTITKAATLATNLFSKATKASPWGLVIAGITAVVSYLAIFRDKTDESTESQKKFNDELERTKATMDLIAGVKVSADNFEFLTDKQKQQLKADAQRGIDELDDLLTKGMIETKAWYEQEKESILKATEDNEVLRKSYLRGLEKDFEERVAKLAGYVDKKKELEKIVAMVPNLSGPVVPIVPVDDKALEKELKAREEVLKQAMQEERNLWKEEYLNQQHSEEEYQQAQYDSEIMFLLKKKALLESYGKDVTDIQGQIYDKMIAEANRLTNARKATEAQEKSSSFSALESTYQEDQRLIKQQYLDGDIKTEKEYQEKIKELELDYLNERKRMLETYGDDVSQINGQILDKQLQQKNTDKDTNKEKGFQAIDNTGDYGQKLNMLQAMYDADLISYQEYEEEKARINEEYEQVREDQTKATFDVIAQAAAAANQVVSALQDMEISKVTRKYDKQIKAAKKAGKDTTKLEEEKEEAINQVKKKYADKQFAASVLQVTATTAVAAMEAYKAMAGIPIIGPVLGAMAAAAAVASGAAQIAVAKQQRDEAKGLKEGGYSDEYVEGYTRSGNPDDVAGVIPVHKNEFVANHESVANPHVRQFLDVFDVAQKNGTVRMINTTQILEQVRTRSGKYAGGFVDEGPAGTSFAATDIPSSGITPELRAQIIELMKENNHLLQVICDKELVVDSRKVRDGIRHIEKLERNVSR
ncbi:phage tail tape measure protein [Bacteroides intestinalis]|jgi:TP901 family phage tail tape measure protein|uniref:Tail tape measure protein n=1 Tax=Siphoviridae sp. ctXQq5 TaxID=2826368 RepID=A0A8S5N1L1_9CAUD|nr:phage tail tape measure protein [Bacteroides intestinalis]DAD88162.1 MAG TPA: tail tape measure protein [Siphoviridae sp. ctXQq5]